MKIFIFYGLYSKAKQDEGAAGTLHVIVAEGNYVAIGEPFANSFMSSPRCLRVHVDTFLGL